MEMIMACIVVLAIAGCGVSCPDGYTCTQNVYASATPGSAIKSYIGMVDDCKAYTLRAYDEPVALVCPHEDASVKALEGAKVHHWAQTDTVRK